jgi:hypothetical protein
MTEHIELSNEAKSLQLGLYEHYKGNKYQVLGVVLHSETYEEMALYKALHGDGYTWVRPLKMFLETVEVNGQSVPRFKFISSEVA